MFTIQPFDENVDIISGNLQLLSVRFSHSPIRDMISLNLSPQPQTPFPHPPASHHAHPQ